MFEDSLQAKKIDDTEAREGFHNCWTGRSEEQLFAFFSAESNDSL